MVKRLFLLRHAKSSWSDPDQADHERSLNSRGREACRLLAAHFAARNIRPSLVLCSAAARTRETFDRLAHALDWEPVVDYREGLYLASAANLLRAIQGSGVAESLMLVGHNPGLEDLAADLAGDGDPDARANLHRKYPTGGLATFRADLSDWRQAAPGKFYLESFVTPAELRTPA